MKLTKYNFRGMDVELTAGRIIQGRDPDLHYYEFRHADGNVNAPRTLNKDVFVNFCGTMVSPQPIEIPNGGLDLTKAEIDKLKYIV